LSARGWSWRGSVGLDRLRGFALLWLLFPVVFFSFSGSKLTAYVLPALPAVALLVGERINCALRAGRGERILRLTASLLLLLAAGGYWYARGHFKLGGYCLAFAVLPLVFVAVAALVRPQLTGPLFLMVAVAVVVSSGVTLRCIAPLAARTESVRDLLIASAARGYGSTPIVQLHTVERTAEFYAGNQITYQPDGEPAKLEGVQQVFDAARRNNGLVLVLVPLKFAAQLTSARDSSTELIADNGRVALVAVRVR